MELKSKEAVADDIINKIVAHFEHKSLQQFNCIFRLPNFKNEN
jgi:hypothetical protein